MTKSLPFNAMWCEFRAIFGLKMSIPSVNLGKYLFKDIIIVTQLISSQQTITLHNQIAICNFFAKKDVIHFTAEFFFMRSSSILSTIRNEIGIGFGSKSKKSLVLAGIGVSTPNVRVGDSIVLIAGVSTPLVIRRDNASTRLVSAAFVKGNMEGVGWNMGWTEEDLEEYMSS